MDVEYSVIPLQQKDIWYVVAHAVLETVVTLVRSEHMLQVVWKAVESWHGGVCGICCQGESIGAKVKPEWAIQLSWALQLYIHNADPWSMTDRSHVHTMEKTGKYKWKTNKTGQILARTIWVTHNYSIQPEQQKNPDSHRFTVICHLVRKISIRL